MNFLQRFFKTIVVLANVLVIVLMGATAYSATLNPAAHPAAALPAYAFPIIAAINAGFAVLFLIVQMYRWLLLPLLGMLVCAGPTNSFIAFNPIPKDSPDSCIKILSYNTMLMAKNEKGPDGNPIVNYLAQSQADIICLQEYATGALRKGLQQRDVEKALKAYPHRSIIRVREGASKIALYSKLPIVKVKQIHFEKSDNGAIAYRLKWGADTITLVNCHLESNKLNAADREMYEDLINTPNREKVKTSLRQLLSKLAKAAALRAPQAQAVAKVLSDSPDRMQVVCGDFNDIPLSYAHRTIAAGLNDAFTESGNGLGISYHENHFWFRIDNILLSPALKAYNCRIDNSIKASDHYPISCHIAKTPQNDK